MKINSVKTISVSAVSGRVDVDMEVSREQAQELRNALMVVDSYKKNAFKAIENDPTKSDWHMVEFCVKNDKVIVSVTDGMAG